MTWRFDNLFLALFGLVSATSVPSFAGPEKAEMTPEKLARRCFVWQKQNCDKATEAADRQLVKSVAAKSGTEPAIQEILKSAWKYLNEVKNPAQALVRFNQVLILNEKNGEGWLGAGQSYLTLHLFAEAEPLLRKSMSLSPSRPEGPLALAWLNAAAKKDYGVAKKFYAEALKRGAPPDGELEKILKAH